MCRKILSLCLAFCLFLAIAPAAFAQEPSIPDRKGTAPAEADWLDPQFDAAPDAWENTPLPVHTVRIGLSFGASAVPEAIFRDANSQGFRIGYYDESYAAVCGGDLAEKCGDNTVVVSKDKVISSSLDGVEAGASLEDIGVKSGDLKKDSFELTVKDKKYNAAAVTKGDITAIVAIPA